VWCPGKHVVIGGTFNRTNARSKVPVRLRQIQRVTQADVITVDSAGQLWMWEIKTGGTLMLNRAQGTFAYGAPHGYGGRPCTTAARYELQRHYTHRALVAEGLPLHASRVLVVRRSKSKSKDGSAQGKVTCKELENAPWL
jgi:hypothetical protein